MRLPTTGLRLFAVAAGLLGVAASGAASETQFLSPGRGEALAPGSVIRVEWRSACESDVPVGFDEAELVLSLDGGLTFPIRVSRELDPCESTITWRVPAIATESARLALRMGEEGDGEAEEIVVLSAPFRILPDVDGRSEPLISRSGEWGQRPEAEASDGRDRLGRSLRANSERLTAPFELPDASLPGSAAGIRPESRGTALIHTAAAVTRRPVSVPEAPLGAPTPLRL
jgi:hypothetical protein